MVDSKIPNRPYMYSILRPILFSLNPETSHEVSLSLLNLAEKTHALGLLSVDVMENPVTVMGIRFPNPVGLAAGLDKNGDYFNALGKLGFGFIEIGTVTPKAQPGNDKPRLFRLPEAQAIINRMGFNNKGVDHLVDQVKQRRYQGILGINIGKNASTPVENAVDDYLIGMQKVYEHADYITINISSPNTQGLRSLQFGDSLKQLLSQLKDEQLRLQQLYKRYVPFAVKIAPDLTDEETRQVAEILLANDIDAVIATNTTLAREDVRDLPFGNESGGLSGLPVQKKSTQMIRNLRSILGKKMPIIGVGGINDAQSAGEKICAGASLVQIYTGFIYKGPAVIGEAAEGIRRLSLQ
jgi:dihydroorotate dehydrogenase